MLKKLMLGCSCAADKVEKLRVYWHWCRILPLVTFGTVSSYQHSIRFAPCGSQWITWATKDGTKAAPCLALTVGLTVSAICFPHTQEAPQLRPDLQRSATSTVGQQVRAKKEYAPGRQREGASFCCGPWGDRRPPRQSAPITHRIFFFTSRFKRL